MKSLTCCLNNTLKCLTLIISFAKFSGDVTYMKIIVSRQALGIKSISENIISQDFMKVHSLLKVF